MLKLAKRHIEGCKFTSRKDVRCKCPWHAEGRIKGRRERFTLGTADTERANKRMRELEDELSGATIRKPLAQALVAFFNHLEVQPSTLKRYSRALEPLADFLKQRGVRYVDQVSVEHLGEYRIHRGVAATTWQTELQIVRFFEHFCFERKWTAERPAKAKTLRARKPRPERERVPFTPEEIIAVRRAADTYGRTSYERLRARAMVLLMRYYGLRISDAALFRRDAIQGTVILLKQKKTGKPLALPLEPEVKKALDEVPLPRGAAVDNEFYFWTGAGSARSHIAKMSEAMTAVFKKSGVADGHSHRFRHTVVNDLLAKGWTFERIAVLLGDDAATLRRYYAHLTLARIDDVRYGLRETMVTSWSREEFLTESPLDGQFGVVPAVGIEPTTYGL